MYVCLRCFKVSCQHDHDTKQKCEHIELCTEQGQCACQPGLLPGVTVTLYQELSCEVSFELG